MDVLVIIIDAFHCPGILEGDKDQVEPLQLDTIELGVELICQLLFQLTVVLLRIYLLKAGPTFAEAQVGTGMNLDHHLPSLLSLGCVVEPAPHGMASLIIQVNQVPDIIAEMDSGHHTPRIGLMEVLADGLGILDFSGNIGDHQRPREMEVLLWHKSQAVMTHEGEVGEEVHEGKDAVQPQELAPTL